MATKGKNEQPVKGNSEVPRKNPLLSLYNSKKPEVHKHPLSGCGSSKLSRKGLARKKEDLI